MMVAIAFSALLLIGLFSVVSELIMRIRLSSRELKGEKLLWWRRGGDEVAAMYQEIFPGTHLPQIRQYIFWFFLIFGLVSFAFVMWKRG